VEVRVYPIDVNPIEVYPIEAYLIGKGVVEVSGYHPTNFYLKDDAMMEKLYNSIKRITAVKPIDKVPT
jgi:hypothetical protein